VAVRRGDDTDPWDLEVRTGAFATARLIGTVEEHGHGSQMVRWRIWPRLWVGSVVAGVVALLVAMWAFDSGATLAGVLFLVLVVAIGIRSVLDAGQAIASVLSSTGP
jgi:hypothetical protein